MHPCIRNKLLHPVNHGEPKSSYSVWNNPYGYIPLIWNSPDIGANCSPTWPVKQGWALMWSTRLTVRAICMQTCWLCCLYRVGVGIPSCSKCEGDNAGYNDPYLC